MNGHTIDFCELELELVSVVPFLCKDNVVLIVSEEVVVGFKFTLALLIDVFVCPSGVVFVYS